MTNDNCYIFSASNLTERQWRALYILRSCWDTPYILKSLHPLLYLFFPFLHISVRVEIYSLCHHNKLFTLVADLLVGAFIKQRGVLKIYKRTTCEDSTLIGIGNIPTPQVLKDGVRLNRWTSSKFYHVYTKFAKINKLICIYIYIYIYIYMVSITYKL